MGTSGCRTRFAYKFPNKVNPTSGNYLASLPVLAVLLFASQVCLAQPQFEVASIKPNVSPERNSTWRTTPGGRFTGENINLMFLLMTAYKIRDTQISGAPAWFQSEKYDILAKGEGSPNQDQLMNMLRDFSWTGSNLSTTGLQSNSLCTSWFLQRMGSNLRNLKKALVWMPGLIRSSRRRINRNRPGAELISVVETNWKAPASPWPG